MGVETQCQLAPGVPEGGGFDVVWHEPREEGGDDCGRHETGLNGERRVAERPEG